jgi:hypothetical protein
MSSILNIFVASVNVHVFETNRKHSVVGAQCFLSYQLAGALPPPPPPDPEKLATNLVLLPDENVK